jgi:ABC-2 type transport system ATP-binding protein
MEWSVQPETTSDTHADQPLLEVEGLTKDYGPVRAVDDLNFTVRRGEIVGLLGPNGAGKSTAMRVLVGYQVPTRGSVRIAGGDVFREGSRIKGRLGYLPENPPLYGEMRVREYVTLSGELKGLRGPELRTALARVAGMLGLDGVWQREIGYLSRGYRQRVGLAQALLADPELLVLDEPATGLDPNQISDLRRLLGEWRARKAILLSTHILAEALTLCDRVLILSRGRLVAEGSPQGLAGRDDAPAATTILVRGGDGDPLRGLAEAIALHARIEVSGEGHGGPLWRIEGELDPPGRRRLLVHLAAHGWDLIEWSAGLSALEHAFRRLTLEEGHQRQEQREE